MAYPRATIRPQRRKTQSSLLSKLSLALFVFVALFCFVAPVRAEDKNEIKGPVIGIDLGTTYSCVAGELQRDSA